jgi:alpha-2-macroglobulin
VHLGITGSPAKYLLIEDPIPAGAEFLPNEATFNIVERPNTWQYWYTRREFHDDHAAIFATDFTKREESFYLLKVINPGSFAISPASVQPMYQPGIQATTDELHLDVQDVAPQNPTTPGEVR